MVRDAIESFELGENFKALIEKSYDTIVITDLKGRGIFLNKSAERLTGYKKREMLGKNIRKIIPPRYWLLCSKNIKAVMSGKPVQVFELEIKNKSGNAIPIETWGQAIKKNGKIVGILITARDISKRKEYEVALKESEEKFRNLFENAVDPILLIDKKGILLEVNKKVEELLGYKKEELIGKKFTEVPALTTKSRLITLKNFIKRMAGFKVESYDIEIIKKNGEKLIGEINAAPIVHKGKIVGDMVIIRDITERKRIEKELKKSVEELKKLDVEKNEFLSIAAHELKTPLAAIHGFSQLLQNEDVFMNKDTRNKYLDIIDKETNRLGRLVSNILDLSRVDLGTIRFVIEKVNLYEIVERIKVEIEKRAKEKGLELTFEIEKNLPKIPTDQEKLIQILLNLIDNAIKYTPKGSVKIKINGIGDFVQFAVADTGIGISKKHFSKIFTRFYQVDSSYTRKAMGSGLGLSICKEYVKALGGEIWFESEKRKGSTFYFTLPLKVKSEINVKSRISL